MIVCPNCRTNFSGDRCPQCGFSVPPGMTPQQRMQYEYYMNQMYLQSLYQEQSRQAQQTVGQQYTTQQATPGSFQQTYSQPVQGFYQQPSSADAQPETAFTNDLHTQNFQMQQSSLDAPGNQWTPADNDEPSTERSKKDGEITSAPFQTWKLVSGIISMILFMVVVFQSCAAGIVNVVADTGESSGSAGLLLAILMLAGGIVSAVTRKSRKNGGNIALIVLFGLAFLFGLTGVAGIFKDLIVWTAWCGICLAIAIAALVINKTHNKNAGRIVAASSATVAIILVGLCSFLGDNSSQSSEIARTPQPDTPVAVQADSDATVQTDLSDNNEQSDDTPTVTDDVSYEITDIHFEYNESNWGRYNYYGYVEILNTGATNLYLDDCTFDLEDNDGHLLQSDTIISSCPNIIAPGEKGYFYNGLGASMIDEGVSITNGVNLVPTYSIEKARGEIIDYVVSDLDLREGTLGRPTVTGRVENTTDNDDPLFYLNLNYSRQ